MNVRPKTDAGKQKINEKPTQFKVRKLEIGLVTVFLLGTCQMWVCQHEKVGGGGHGPPGPPGSDAYVLDDVCLIESVIFVPPTTSTRARLS